MRRVAGVNIQLMKSDDILATLSIPRQADTLLPPNPRGYLPRDIQVVPDATCILEDEIAEGIGFDDWDTNREKDVDNIRMRGKVVSNELIAGLICEKIVFEGGLTAYAGVCMALKIVFQALGAEFVSQLLDGSTVIGVVLGSRAATNQLRWKHDGDLPRSECEE